MSAKQLDNWPLIESNMPPSGCVLAAMGGFFAFVFGAFAYTVATAPDVGDTMRTGTLGVAGAIFLLSLVAIGAGYGRMRKYSAHHAMTRTKLATPWEWDHPWGDKSVTDRTYKRKKDLGCLAFGAVAFMIPFNIAYLADPDADGIGVVILFDAVAVALIGAALYFARRRAKYGQMRLQFSKFPYTPGEEVQAMLTGGAWIQELLNLKATLRCIEEWTTYRPGAKNTRVSRTASAVYEEVIEYDVTALKRTQLDRIPIRLRIPEGIAVNQLLMNPATYWDLEVEAQVRGVDYRGHFLLPIYGQVG